MPMKGRPENNIFGEIVGQDLKLLNQVDQEQQSTQED